MPFRFLSRLIDDPDPVVIIPFGGYANDEMIHAQARILQDEGIDHAEEDSFIKNIYHSYKRFESDEEHGARVRVSWGNKKIILISDAEGYISLDVPHDLELVHKETTWIPVTYELLNKKDEVVYKITDSVMKPSPQAEFGIVSDIDDTVLHTGVSSFLKWRVILNSFVKHSHKRMPLEGAGQLYHLLYKGSSGYSQNPFFYLSNSPWNLYEYISAFLTKYDFPKGTLMLRDMGLSLRKKKSFMEGNKYRKIVHILETYPYIPFILIGDAAEIDTDIYLKIASQFQGRILTIYIRSVNNKAKIRRIEALIEKNTNIEVILINNSNEAINHAIKKGYIEEADKVE